MDTSNTVGKMTLGSIAQEIKRCKKCPLYRGATKAVPGEGPADARVVLVGQNPGRDEDQSGRPFVGRSGKFLDQVLESLGLQREACFITSVVKHKTPNNRTPTSAEITACMPYLERQIAVIKPETVVLMGTVAQKAPRNADIRYIETYHPAAAMRFPRFRKQFERDFEHLGKLYHG